MPRSIPGDKLTDNSIISFGKHKGKELANVPSSWLLWYYDDHKFDKNNALCDYIYNAGLVKISES